MMMRTVSFLAVMALFVTGCQTMPWQQNSNSSGDLDSAGEGRVSDVPAIPEVGLRLSPENRFPDVPLPEGVKEDSERTFVYEADNLQIGNMIYSSKSHASDIAQFYIRECPTAAWELESTIQADVVVLSFKKPGKRLKVTISDLGVTRGRELVLLLIPDDGS